MAPLCEEERALGWSSRMVQAARKVLAVPPLLTEMLEGAEAESPRSQVVFDHNSSSGESPIREEEGSLVGHREERYSGGGEGIG